MSTANNGNEKQKTIRSFIAIELPANIRSSIREVQQRLRLFNLKMRWVRPEGIHLTLKFLGDIPSDGVEPIGGVIQESAAAFAPLSLIVKGIGVFPGIRRPRVLWVGLTGELDPLMRLQKTLDEKLEVIGYPKENRLFKAHLTIARFKGHVDSKRLNEAMAEFQTFESEMFVADKLTLFKSDLKPSGAVYTELMSAELTNR